MDKRRISFAVSGEQVVGDLFIPDAPGPHPAVIVGGPMTSVKEQVTGVYAKALADRGIAALSIDHRYYGQSTGEPRQYEYYPHKIEDLRAGVNQLAKEPDIKPTMLGVAGICLGVGYVLWAAIDTPQIKSVGGVVGYYRDVPEMKSRDPEGFKVKVAQGRNAREQFEKTGKVEMIPAAALEGDAAMTLQPTYDYYATPRAGVENYTNAFAVMSREHFLQFDVQSAAARLNVPITMVHSQNALSPNWAIKFHDALSVDKKLHWID
ncbi:MAG: alpha/beta hydrolase, partial [Aquisalinus sp.]|nr:alpha/beta hydrolase [Aquisalinus sp.]